MGSKNNEERNNEEREISARFADLSSRFCRLERLSCRRSNVYAGWRLKARVQNRKRMA